MKRILWTTDIHLNFVSKQNVEAFLKQLADAKADGLLFSGDIGESTDVVDYLSRLTEALSCPVYFVLGNHDFYLGSISEVRQQMSDLCNERPGLHYLTQAGVLDLTTQVGVVGHDGWADARIGDYENSEVMMNDYQFIKELAPYSKQDRWPVLQSLGDEAAQHIRSVLPSALDQFEQVFLVTHVPPTRESCWHNDEISDDEWAPHFTCQAMGEAILSIMQRYPHRQLTVLCGHTHGSGCTQPLPNVTIWTGGAQYGSPTITKVFELP